MTIHRVVDSPFRDGSGNKPIWGTPLDRNNGLAKGIVRYWHFAEEQGPRVSDIVCDNNHGSLKAFNYTWSGGPSMSFDGSTTYADSNSDLGIPALIPQVGVSQFANDASSFCIMCWFYPTAASQSAHLISRWDNAVASNGGKVWSLLLGDSTGTAAGNRVWFGYQSSDAFGSVVRTITTNAFVANKWNCVAGNFTNTATTSQMNLVLNGVVSNLSALGGIWFANANTSIPGVTVGAARNGAGRAGYFQGKILAGAIWHGWLDTDALQALYYQPWSIFLESQVRRWYRTTTVATGQPLVPRIPDHDDSRVSHFANIVQSILNSLLRQGQIIQTGQTDYSINAAAIQANAGVTSWNTRKGDVTLQPSDLPLFTSTSPGAVPLSGGGTANFIRADGNWVTAVQSAALSMPSEFSTAGSPITGSGTFVVTKTTQTANQVWAGPTTGSPAAPTFRALVSADLPGGTIVNSVSNSDGTLTISPTTGAVVASLALGHANTWTANVTIDATHHLILSEMTAGSILFALGSPGGQVGQDNAHLFWDNTNKFVGFGTASPGSPITGVSSLTSGIAYSLTTTQTQANSSDTADVCLQAKYTLTAATATNEFIVRTFSFVVVNNLTGGGHIQNARVIDLVLTLNTGTTTDVAELLYFEVNGAGTLTQINFLHIPAFVATNFNGVVIDTPTATNYVLYGEGTTPGTGGWFAYCTDNIASFFGGWVYQNQGHPSVTADYTNATNSFTNVTDLTISSLVSGNRYFGRFVLKCINSTAAEGIKFDFNGGSATMSAFWAAAYIGTSGGTDTAGTLISTTLAGVINWTTITGESTVIIDVAFTASSNGTLIIRSGENSVHASGTVTIRLGSYVVIDKSSN